MVYQGLQVYLSGTTQTHSVQNEYLDYYLYAKFSPPWDSSKNMMRFLVVGT